MSEQQREKFDELQVKYIGARRQLLQCNAQLQMNERDKRRSELTINELERLDDDTATYRSLGKMFVQTPIGQLRDEYRELFQQCSQDSVTLHEQQTKLEKSYSEIENELRDIIKKSMIEEQQQ